MIDDDKKICPNCGSQCDIGDLYCINCSFKFDFEETNEGNKKNTKEYKKKLKNRVDKYTKEINNDENNDNYDYSNDYQNNYDDNDSSYNEEDNSSSYLLSAIALIIFVVVVVGLICVFLGNENTKDITDIPQKNNNIEKQEEITNEEHSDIVEPVYTQNCFPRTLNQLGVSRDCFEKANFGDKSYCTTKEIELIEDYYLRGGIDKDYNNNYCADETSMSYPQCDADSTLKPMKSERTEKYKNIFANSQYMLNANYSLWYRNITDDNNGNCEAEELIKNLYWADADVYMGCPISYNASYDNNNNTKTQYSLTNNFNDLINNCYFYNSNGKMSNDQVNTLLRESLDDSGY